MLNNKKIIKNILSVRNVNIGKVGIRMRIGCDLYIFGVIIFLSLNGAGSPIK